MSLHLGLGIHWHERCFIHLQQRPTSQEEKQLAGLNKDRTHADFPADDASVDPDNYKKNSSRPKQATLKPRLPRGFFFIG
jgi:hypothetical protein